VDDRVTGEAASSNILIVRMISRSARLYDAVKLCDASCETKIFLGRLHDLLTTLQHITVMQF
jgi:hypothetical protein